MRCLLLTDTNVPDGSVEGETKLGLEGGQDLLLDLLHCVTAQAADLQRLADLPITAHCKQDLQLLRTTHTRTKLTCLCI